MSRSFSWEVPKSLPKEHRQGTVSLPVLVLVPILVLYLLASTEDPTGTHGFLAPYIVSAFNLFWFCAFVRTLHSLRTVPVPVTRVYGGRFVTQNRKERNHHRWRPSHGQGPRQGQGCSVRNCGETVACKYPGVVDLHPRRSHLELVLEENKLPYGFAAVTTPADISTCFLCCIFVHSLFRFRRVIFLLSAERIPTSREQIVSKIPE
jgi:hypothetical protein